MRSFIIVFFTKCFIKSRRRRMASQVALCTAHTYNTSIGKSEGKRPSRNPKLMWEGNTTMILEELARVKSGFKQYGMQPSDRTFAGKRASSAAAGMFFPPQEDFFFCMFVTTVLHNRYKLQHSFLRSENVENNNHIIVWNHQEYFTLYENILRSLISAQCVVRSEELRLWYCANWTEHYASLGLLQISIVHRWNNGVQGNPQVPAHKPA